MDVPPEDQMRNQEQQPQLDEGIGMYSEDMTANNEEPEYITEYGDGTESAQRAQRPNGATVLCRVCDVAVSLEGRNQQHVVKCHSCDEETPIRPAPPGKKYVRCPCNCLLICKASLTRIACPRNNCRRVITLVGQRDPGTAIRAPTGSCRVNCSHCHEIFLFNTLTNALANCPHCKKYSTVGTFARKRALLFFVLAAVVAILAVILTMLTNASKFNKIYMIPILVGLYACALYTAYKSFNYYTCKKSEIIGPVGEIEKIEMIRLEPAENPDLIDQERIRQNEPDVINEEPEGVVEEPEDDDEVVEHADAAAQEFEPLEILIPEDPILEQVEPVAPEEVREETDDDNKENSDPRYA